MAAPGVINEHPLGSNLSHSHSHSHNSSSIRNRHGPSSSSALSATDVPPSPLPASYLRPPHVLYPQQQQHPVPASPVPTAAPRPVLPTPDSAGRATMHAVLRQQQQQPYRTPPSSSRTDRSSHARVLSSPSVPMGLPDLAVPHRQQPVAVGVGGHRHRRTPSAASPSAALGQRPVAVTRQDRRHSDMVHSAHSRMVSVSPSIGYPVPAAPVGNNPFDHPLLRRQHNTPSLPLDHPLPSLAPSNANANANANTNTNTNTDRPTHKGKTSSLAGFDPLLDVDTRRTPSLPTQRHTHSSVAKTQPSLAVTIAPAHNQQQPNVSTKVSPRHRKGAQTFCVADLRSISQDAMDQENINDLSFGYLPTIGSGLSESSSVRPNGKAESPVATDRVDNGNGNSKSNSKGNESTNKNNHMNNYKNNKTSPKQNVSNHQSPDNKDEPDRDVSPVAIVKDRIASAFLRSAKKSNDAAPTRPVKKGSWRHRRTKSLENKNVAAAKTAASQKDKAAKRSSVPKNTSVANKGATDLNASSSSLTTDNNNSSNNNNKIASMYPAMIKDLMGLKVEQPAVPSLAKPSPTSFLTGREDEVVRTCEIEPAPHQVDIPALSEFINTARLVEFVDTYRQVDQNFDLSGWKGKTALELKNEVRISEHKALQQSLAECGPVTVQGIIAKGETCDSRLEVCIFEGQRNFVVVFRGTTEQQNKLGKKSSKSGFLPLDSEHKDIQVFSSFKEEYVKLETDCFALLDKLTEENPFCDIVFTGHSFGAAMATLAAYKYANARPMVLVSCLPMASPKVGSVSFRHAVNSSPNLKVMRLEYGQDGKCQAPSHGGVHVGHTLVLRGSSAMSTTTVKTSCPMVAYKFDTPKYKKFKTTYPDLRSYVNALEEVERLKLDWSNEFVGTSGKGVIVNNETRLVV